GHSESPTWMRSFATITPVRAALTGVALVVGRPDVLFICVPAGLAIGASGLDHVDVWVAGAFFVAIAASSVAVPILAYAAAGNRLDESMARLKDWMEKNNAALMAAILIVIGAMVLYNGIDALKR
ncbi:GAP family protein, partial [Pseudomonas citronellolis]